MLFWTLWETGRRADISPTDCFHPLCGDRLAAIVEAQTREAEGVKSLEDGFVHYACASLPHFLAMFCSPAATVTASPDTPAETLPDMPADTAVIVLDSLSALVNHALPRTADRKGTPLMANGKRGPAAHEKRTQVLQYIVAALERLAETRNLAVVLLTQCASRVQADRGGAALVPAINAVVWDRGIATRLVLFRIGHGRTARRSAAALRAYKNSTAAVAMQL